MKLQFATLTSIAQRDAAIELATDLICEDLGLDLEPSELRVLIVDDLPSRKNGAPLSGQCAGSVLQGFCIRLLAGRPPRDTLCTLAHEARHAFQHLHSIQSGKALSDEFCEVDARRYADYWRHQLAKNATWADVLALFKQLDKQLWQEAQQHAREHSKKFVAQWGKWVPRESVKKNEMPADIAKMIEDARKWFGPREAGRQGFSEYTTAKQRGGIEYR